MSASTTSATAAPADVQLPAAPLHLTGQGVFDDGGTILTAPGTSTDLVDVRGGDARIVRLLEEGILDEVEIAARVHAGLTRKGLG